MVRSEAFISVRLSKAPSDGWCVRLKPRLATACLVLLCTLVPPSPARAQQEVVRFGKLSVEDGLSHSWVRCLLKDYRGFLWVGTAAGLNRYDGTGFVQYQHDPNDPTSLAGWIVSALFEDSRNRLWVSAGGLHLYHRDTDSFELHPQARVPEFGFSIRAISEDSTGRIWLATDGEGVFCYEPEKRISRRYVHDPGQPASLCDDAAIDLLTDSRGRLWIGTRSGLDRYDPVTDSFIHVLITPQIPEQLQQVSAESLLEGEDGSLWLGTMGDGLLRFFPDATTVLQYLPDPDDPSSIGGSRIAALTSDGANALYIAVENVGLDVLNTRTGKIVEYRPNFDDPTSLSSKSPWSLYRDDQGIIWIGTYNAGIDYISPYGQRFALMQARSGGLSDPNVMAVMEDHAGNLWIGTDGGGLNFLDRSSDQFTYYRKDDSDPHSLASDSVLSLLEDGSGSIWLGTWSGGLHRLDPRTGRFKRYPRGDGLSDPPADWTIVGTSEGKLLLGLWGEGVQLFDPDTGSFTPLAQIYPGVNDSGEVFAIAVDEQQRLWIGGTIGLEVVDQRSGSIQRFAIDTSDPLNLIPGYVFEITVDSRANIWVGTQGGGLVCFDAASLEPHRYTGARSLSTYDIGDILEDGEGSLWLGTSHGIIKLEKGTELPSEPRFLSFDVHDGLQGNEFRHGAAYRCRNGEMFFGGNRGLSFFFPEEVHQNPVAPSVIFTGLRVFNKPVEIGAPGSPLEKAITETSELTLSYRHSVLTFEFAALNFILPQKNRYQYRLDGFDPDWNRVGNRHTATYTNLPAGSYTLRVRAANNDGVWSDEDLTLDLHVTGPLWQTGWFRALVILCLGMLVLIVYRVRLNAVKRRQRELESLVEQRTHELKNEIAERRHAQEALNRLNQELGRRVNERTAELGIANEQLAEERDRLGVTLRSIADGVIATDVQGRVTLMNRVAEELTGWRLAEAHDRPLVEVFRIVHRQTREPIPSPADEVLQQGAVQVVQPDALLCTKDGRELVIADSAAPIRDPESKIVGAVVVFRDVTERQRLDERLRSTQKLEALGVLAGGLAHDFNNLLTGIFGYLQVALHRYSDQDRSSGPLAKATAVLEKARALTRQLLTFSRAGQPITAPVALTDLLSNSAQFALSGSNVSYKIEAPEDLWLCEADAHQIDQVVDNLLLNARQAMNEGGEVTLCASNIVALADDDPLRAGKRYVRLDICDQGKGIPPDLLSRVFEPFFTTKTTGSGLGLATSYSIVRKHGGHIEVESTLDGGTTFTVYLPASVKATATELPERIEPTAGRGKILVVDDEEYVRDVLQELLSNLGYSVITVASGEEAVALIGRQPATAGGFDLLILDLTIPGGMGGVETLAQLREADVDVPALAASGYSSDPVMASPNEYGFSGALVKPFSETELSTVVSDAIASAQQESQE